MISIELKAEFRRATRGIDENAVAHRLSLVFIDSLRGIVTFREKSSEIDENHAKSRNTEKSVGKWIFQIIILFLKKSSKNGIF